MGLKTEFVLLAMLSSAVSCSHTGLEDNFVVNRAPFWRSGSKSGDSAPWSSAIRFEGRNAYRFEVKKGDNQTRSDKKNGTERSEIYLDPDQNGDLIGKETWYSFGIFIPNDFPLTETRVVVGQWKSDDKDGSSNSPSISNRFKSGVFSIKLKTQQGEREFPVPLFKIGKWNDLIYRIILSPTNGELDVWLNNQQVISFRGPTAIVNRIHLFKMGIYRDAY